MPHPFGFRLLKSAGFPLPRIFLDAGPNDLVIAARRYFGTICFRFRLAYPNHRIKSGGDFRRPATEPRKGYGANLRKKGYGL